MNRKITYTVLIFFLLLSVSYNIYQHVQLNEYSLKQQAQEQNRLTITSVLGKNNNTEEVIEELNTLEEEIKHNDVRETSMNNAREELEHWSEWAASVILSLDTTDGDIAVAWHWTPEQQTVWMTPQQNQVYDGLVEIRLKADLLIEQAADNTKVEKIHQLRRAFESFASEVVDDQERPLRLVLMSKDKILQSFQQAQQDFQDIADP